MKADFGKTHPLVQLTLDCLEYLSEDRPSAMVVLRGLEEVGTTVTPLPQNCTLDLIQQRTTIKRKPLFPMTRNVLILGKEEQEKVL